MQLPDLSYKAWFQCMDRVPLTMKNGRALHTFSQLPENEQLLESYRCLII